MKLHNLQVMLSILNFISVICCMNFAYFIITLLSCKYRLILLFVFHIYLLAIKEKKLQITLRSCHGNVAFFFRWFCILIYKLLLKRHSKSPWVPLQFSAVAWEQQYLTEKMLRLPNRYH